MDFNPFSPRTDPLLFSWDELTSGSITSDGGEPPVISPVIRVVEKTSTVRPHDLHESRVPQVTEYSV